jgi:hypothetical protein
MPRTERVERVDDLAAALSCLGLTTSRPVVVVVGDAAGLSDAGARRVEPVVTDVLVPLCEELGAALVDGGTDSGVMRLVGRAFAARHATFPLVGVVAAGTVVGGVETVPDPAHVEPNHTHLLVVPGSSWGDESPWLTRVATALADGAPMAGVLIGGGEVSVHDVAHLVDTGIPAFVITGTGRLADALARSDSGGDDAIAVLRTSDLVRTVDALDRPHALRTALRRALTRD